MAALSDFLENKLINHVLRATSYTTPGQVYLALFTADPTDANVGTEVSGGSYARQAISFVAPNDGVTTNNADVNFPISTADWGTVSHFGLYDAATGGNLLIHGAFSIAKPIYNGDQFIVRNNDLDIQFS